MKRITSVIAAFTLLATWGCSNKSVGACDNCNNASDTVIVRIKQSVNVFNCCADQFTLTFNRVTEDSRCPLGGYCITSGIAKIAISIGNSGDVTELQMGFSKNLPVPNHSFSAKL